MMKAKEIRGLTKEKIEAKIADLKEELFNLKFQAALGNLEKPTRMNEIKRTIARMKTILTEGSYLKEEEAKPKKKASTTKKTTSTKKKTAEAKNDESSKASE